LYMFYLTKYIYRPCIVNGIFVAVSTRRASTLGKAYTMPSVMVTM
jgi:hypothetical protein